MLVNFNCKLLPLSYCVSVEAAPPIHTFCVQHTHTDTNKPIYICLHVCVYFVGLLFLIVYARVGEHKMRE